jgi:hypothetical protein
MRTRTMMGTTTRTAPPARTITNLPQATATPRATIRSASHPTMAIITMGSTATSAS